MYNKYMDKVKVCSIEQFQNQSIPTPWKVIVNSYGEGDLKSQNFRRKVKAELEFSGGRKGAKQNIFFGGQGVRIFSGTVHFRKLYGLASIS